MQTGLGSRSVAATGSRGPRGKETQGTTQMVSLTSKPHFHCCPRKSKEQMTGLTHPWRDSAKYFTIGKALRLSVPGRDRTPPCLTAVSPVGTLGYTQLLLSTAAFFHWDCMGRVRRRLLRSRCARVPGSASPASCGAMPGHAPPPARNHHPFAAISPEQARPSKEHGGGKRE